MQAIPTLYMIPGTGTDRRMFAPQLENFPDMVVPQWLTPLGRKESLTSYARRLNTSIDTSRPFLLGGVSLGGMIAQEMARELRPVGLVLIATCSTSKALPLIWRLQGKLTRMTPDIILKTLFYFLSVGVKLADKKHLPHKDDYAQMLREMPSDLVRWQAGAATEWMLMERLSMPVMQIHGSKDKVIPLKHVEPQVVIDGGHLINVTHASQVNDFIRSCMQRMQPYETRQSKYH